jgi:hypothetical protein
MRRPASHPEDHAMKTFHIDCELDYDVPQQSLFVFNLGVPSTPAQRVVAETVSTTPANPLDEFRDEAGRNRFFRVDVPPGQFSIRYLATVALQAPDRDPFACETPLAKVPGEVLAFVQGSRYCEVEALYGFAVRKFGSQPPGYQRVHHALPCAEHSRKVRHRVYEVRGSAPGLSCGGGSIPWRSMVPLRSD